MKLVIESVRSAITQPVASVVTALIVAGVCAAILSTTGQTVQAEQQVLSRIDDAGTRSILISDINGSAELTRQSVDRIARISGVEWAIGLGPATDVRPAGNPGGNPAPIRTLHGELPSQISTNADLQPGAALVGPAAQQELGLKHPIGGVLTDSGGLAVVGSFRADDPLAFLERSLITRPDSNSQQVRSIHILAKSPGLVASVTDAALLLLGPQDPTSIGVETSETLAGVRAAVQGELGRFGRNLITLVLAAGLVLTGLNVYGTVNNRRRDLGRRRALGASRLTIIGLIATQTALSATAGAVIGAATTWGVLTAITGTAPNLGFTVAVIVLAVLTAITAAVPPAIVAAYRDPVRVLRVP